MRTKHFEIFEEKHLPPDWDALEDQLAHWIYDPEVLKMIIKRRVDEGWKSTTDDPEDILNHYLGNIRLACQIYNEDKKRRKIPLFEKIKRSLSGIGVNYNSLYGGYSLVPLSDFDPLRLFYPVVTDKNSDNIASHLFFQNKINLTLSFMSDNGLLCISEVVVPRALVIIHGESWSKIAGSKDKSAYKTCLAAWIVAASNKTRLSPKDFEGDLGKIPIPRWVAEELKGS